MKVPDFSIMYLQLSTSDDEGFKRFIAAQNSIFDRAVHGILLEKISVCKRSRYVYWLKVSVSGGIFGALPILEWFPKGLVALALNISLRFQHKVKGKISILSYRRVANSFSGGVFY